MTLDMLLARAGLLAATLALAAGCGKSGDAGKAELPPPIVTVAPPAERTVTRYELATGRAEPLEQVEIRARVSGYLMDVAFEPGTEVKRDALLCEIDPEPYKADLARAKASRATAEADLATAEADLIRAKSREATTKISYDREETALKKGVGAEATRDVAKGMYDEAVATGRASAAKIKQSDAKIEEAKANVRNAELNLGYCTVRAPIAGKVGDKLVTPGNLVTGGIGSTTLLTTVVADEKMDVAFDADENTLQRIQQAVRDGKIKAPAAGEIPAEAGVAVHGTTYPLKGLINFSDNRVDPKTGTIRMKARFDNPRPDKGQRLLAAGMYARVRVPIGEPVKAMLVPDSAFGSDQGIRHLYVVGADNKAVRMDAATGALEGDLRVVESVVVPGEGKPRPLAPGDRVIVSGIQRVRPGMVVDPKPATK
ncbi:efflux RND transporter periplasmic adaptor subunit [Gemmata sp.]|uniref:efflux RND transporter periplasmic adaptor subunit n=1 Tax=Gemmata sp. TaxID=1914242 RepID=UPI003F7222BB